MGLFVLFTPIPLFSSTGAQCAPACFISDRNLKYYRFGATLTQYFRDDKQIKDQNHSTVYTCSKDFKLIDFDWAQEKATQILAVLFSNQKFTFLEIWDLHNNNRILIKNMTLYHPWKIQFADVDRDSIDEVCLGVYKKSPLHPVFTKRLFIFNFQHGLQPKWLGSRLSHPFSDFAFWSTGNRTILIAMELDSKAQPMLNAYEWDCFGFTSIKVHNNAVVDDAPTLHRGFTIENGLYQQSLFVINQDSSYQKIDINLEETDP